MTNKHLIETLIKCFMSENISTVYNKRWDVWLIQNGFMLEYANLIVKNDEELNKLLYEAKWRAHQLKNSPLSKALSLRTL